MIHQKSRNWVRLDIWLSFFFILSTSQCKPHSNYLSVIIILSQTAHSICQHSFVSFSSFFFFLPESPVQRDIFIEQNIMKAAFGAVLCHYGNIWYFYTTTNEFAEIGMVKFPVKMSRNHSTQIIFMDLLPTFCTVTGKLEAWSQKVKRKVKQL